MEITYNTYELGFLSKHSHAALSICNNRNLIIADFVVFREYDNGGLGMELFKDEHWAKLSMHKAADVTEYLFFIPRLVFYFYDQGKISI